MNPVIFWILAVPLVLFALGVVLTKSIFRAALYLAGALVTTALIYLVLQAEILAFMQILLYAGGVITLLAFAIMLTKDIVAKEIRLVSRNLFWGFVGALVLFLVFLYFLFQSHLNFTPSPMPENLNLQVGVGIFRQFVVPFEVLSVLLLAAIIGAIVLARKED